MRKFTKEQVQDLARKSANRNAVNHPDQDWHTHYYGFIHGFQECEDIFLNIENSVGVSDATTEDGALARDREWNESGEDVESQIASEHVPIGNRISDGNYCRQFMCSCKLGKDTFNCLKDCDRENDRQ